MAVHELVLRVHFGGVRHRQLGQENLLCAFVGRQRGGRRDSKRVAARLGRG
jgi:hypothetical protein